MATISRPKRWQNACSEILTAIEAIRLLISEDTIDDQADKIEEHCTQVKAAQEELSDLLSEYGEWLDNLPENLRDSVIAEKLEELITLNVDSFDEGLATVRGELQTHPIDIETIEMGCEELENPVDFFDSADLPLGFGRD